MINSCSDSSGGQTTQGSQAAGCGVGQPASLNPQTILERCFHQVAFAETLLREFQTSSYRRATEIARLVVQRRWADMAEEAHALKGAAGIIGAERLRALAAAAERAGRSGEFSQASQAAEELYAEVQRCMAEATAICEDWQRRSTQTAS